MKAYLVLILSLLYGLSNAKTVITAEVSEITASSANLCGQVSLRLKPGAEYELGFIITKDAPIEQGVKETILQVEEIMPDNLFSIYARGLESNTKYNVKAYIKTNKKEFFSEIIQFTTKDIIATLETGKATNITEFKSTLNGCLKTDEDNLALEKEIFFLYSSKTSDLSELKKSGTKANASVLSKNAYESVIKSLEPGTMYYYVICSKIHDKWFYGSVSSFQTANLLVKIQNNDAINVGVSKATLSCKLKIESIEQINPTVYFLVSESKDFPRNQQKIFASAQGDGTYYAGASALRNATTYYFKTYVQVNNSIIVSETEQFMTQNFPFKKYSGSYHGGYATYTYFEMEDGSRVYHGRFEYSINKNYRDIEITGVFKNGKRDSIWVYKATNGNSTSLPSNEYMTISYKNGIHDGPLSYIASANYSGEGGRGQFVKTDDNKAPEGMKCSASFVNNEPVGLLEFSVLDGRRWELFYNSEGRACGIWKYYTQKEDYFMNYDSGQVAYYIDKERGEKNTLQGYVSIWNNMISAFNARCKMLDDICEPYPYREHYYHANRYSEMHL